MSIDKTVQTLPLAKGGSCPTCGKAADLTYRPFCSKRCADVDLGQWLNEGFKIESEEELDTDEYEPG